MLLLNKKFLKPTKEARIISILENLHINPQISQNELGKRSLLSSTMVNNYLKELEKREYIQTVPIDGKRLRYELTEKGESYRRNMLGLYMAEIVQIYSSLKYSIQDKLKKLISSGIKKLAFFGASTTCEVVLSAIGPLEISVVALVDSDPQKQGTMLSGYVISPPEILKYLQYDGILITSFARHVEIKDKILKELKLNHIRIFSL